MGMKIRAVFILGLGSVASFPAVAQNLPLTTQQLQQQHDLTIRNESSTVHDNLNQSIQQTPPQPQPIITPSGRVVSRPPGYIPMPSANSTNPDR
jgi:hypothetical protein